MAEIWARPEGTFPDALWPVDVLHAAERNPTSRLTVSEDYFTDDRHGGIGCVLVRPEDVDQALAGTSWVGHDVGTVSVWDGGGFDDGQRVEDRGLHVEFFAQGRRPAGAKAPVVEISQPLPLVLGRVPRRWRLAVPRLCRSRARTRAVGGFRRGWRLDVRALEFRTFLHAAQRAAILQIDCVPKVPADDFESIDDAVLTDWGTSSSTRASTT